MNSGEIGFLTLYNSIAKQDVLHMDCKRVIVTKKLFKGTLFITINNTKVSFMYPINSIIQFAAVKHPD